MGCTLDSAYWTCNRCCRQFEWAKDERAIVTHKCARDRKQKKATKFKQQKGIKMT